MVVSAVERGGQAAAARLKPHGRCFIKRMGNSHVHTVEDLELGVLKRRIASALLRKGVLDKAEEAATAGTAAAAAVEETNHLGLQVKKEKKEEHTYYPSRTDRRIILSEKE